MRRLPSFAFASFALFAGCQPSADVDPVGSLAAPLLGGTVAEPGEDPGVVALANSFGPFCTGTLVTPRTVLTAAHCIDQFDPANPQLGIFFGSDIRDGSRVSVVGGQVRPGWDGMVGFDKSTDIGLLLLKQAQDPALPLPMNRRAPVTGEDYRHVGFGVFDNAMPSDGRKRQGTVTISEVGDGLVYSGNNEISICFGDSGGPGFVKDEQGVEYVAGVHSFTSTSNGGCRFPAGDSRVDDALDFIQPWIDDNDPTCGPDRICAATGCTEDPDCASCGADGICVVCADPDPDCPSKSTGDACQQDDECSGATCVTWDGDYASRFCSEDCSTDGDCPDGMGCRTFSNQRLCYWTNEPPGRLGAKCDADSECFSNLCDDSECVMACNIALGLDCPADFTCTDNGAGDYFCRADAKEGGGGCQTGGNSATSLALLVLAFLGLATRTRRRA